MSLNKMVIIITTIILLICSFLSKAVKDTLDHHFIQSIFIGINDRFIDPSISWTNKYKQYPKDMQPKFWGSTTIFVWTTDLWHLCDMIERTCWQIILTIWINAYFDLTWYYVIAVFVGIKILCACVFHFPYTYWFIKKK